MRFLLAITIVLSVIGLSGDGVDVADYFPMRAGIKLDYAGEGNEYAPFLREFAFVQRPFVQFSDSNGGTVVVYVYKVEKGALTQVLHIPEFYDRINFIEELKETKSITQKEEVILQAPLKAGTRWVSNGIRREIVSVYERVSVPFGTFEQVIKVKVWRDEDQEWYGFDYFSRGLGLIKREFFGNEYYVASYLKKVIE